MAINKNRELSQRLIQNATGRQRGKISPHQAVLNRVARSGIQIVQPKAPTNIYSSPTMKPTQGTKKTAQDTALGLVNGLLPNGLKNRTGLDIATGTAGLSQATEAAERVLKGGANLLVYDLETFGTPKQNRMNNKNGMDLFGVAQISLLKHDRQTKENDLTVLSVRMEDDMKNYLSSKIDELEKNPQVIHQWDDDTKRSVADLALYRNKDHFQEKVVNGQRLAVMTGQADKPNYKGTELANAESIAGYRSGLNNLTDARLTNDRKSVYTALEYYTQDNPVLAGHNNISFDQPGMQEFFSQKVRPSERLTQTFQDAELDSYPLYRNIADGNTFATDTFQLGDLYSSLNKDGSKQAHFSGDDTLMTLDLLNSRLDEIEKGTINLNNAQSVEKSNLFFATKGTGRYYDSDFNKNRGQYDLTLRFDPEKKAFVRTRDFQEPSLIAGDEYEFMGSLGRQAIDGVEHEGIVFRDTSNDVYKFMFRQNNDEIADLFNNHLEKSDQVSNNLKIHIQKDAGRRHYESLFDVKARGKNDTIKKRLDYSYDVIDKYDRKVEELKGKASKEVGGMVKSQEAIHEEAIRWVDAELNKDKSIDDTYRYSRSKIRKTVQPDVRAKLLSEKDIWNNIGEEAERVVRADDATGFSNAHRMNAFYQPAYQKITEFDMANKEDIGDKSLRFLQLPDRSVSGEYTYLQVNSLSSIESRVRNLTSTGTGKGKGQAMSEVDHFLRGLGPLVDDDKKAQYRKKIDHELAKHGKVNPRTIRNISQEVHQATSKATTDGKHIVSRVPARNMRSAAETQRSGRVLYPNFLRSREDPAFKKLVDEAAETSFSNLHTSASIDAGKFNLISLSDPSRQRIKRASDITEKLEENVMATRSMYGMPDGARPDILKRTNHEEEIEKILGSYREKGYEVALDMENESGKVMLSYSHKDNYKKLSAMTAAERLYDESIETVALPMPNKDGSIPINRQNLKQNYRVTRNNGKLGITSTTNDIYADIRNMPDRIDKLMKEAEVEGRPMKRREAERIILQKQQNKARNKGMATNFFNAKFDKNGLSGSSVARNMNPQIDFNAQYENYAKQHHPDMYKKFQEHKEKTNNPYAKFGQSWGYGRDHASAMAQIRAGAIHEWNNTTGKTTGIKVNPYGLNVNQWQSGMLNLTDPRNTAMFGKNNPGSREQILKTQNYKLMGEERLQNYYAERFGSDVHKTDRVFQEMKSLETDAYDGFINAENGVAAINARQMFTNDEELHSHLGEIKKDLGMEISKLKSENNPMNDKKIETLEADLKQINSNKLSVYEEQMLVRESLMNNIELNDTMAISLKDNEVLSDSVQELLAQTEIAEGDMAKQEGLIKFKHSMNMSEMQSIGLVDEDNKITIGKIVSDDIEQKGTSKRLYKDSILEGIEMTEDGPRLIVKNQRRLRDGDKFIDAIGGTRNTAVGIRDSLMDRLNTRMGGRKDTDFISEHIKTSRYPTGQLMGTMVNTSYHNLMEDFDEAFYHGGGKLKATREWMKTAQPGEGYEVARRAFLGKHFVDPMNKTLGSQDEGILSLNDDGVLLFDNDRAADRFVGESGYGIFKDVHQMATDDFDFSEKAVMTGKRAHNTSRWARAGHGAKISTRELDMMSQLFTDLDGGSIKAGEDTEFMKHFGRLMKEENNPHYEYSENIRKVIKGMNEEGDLKDIQKSGNVIFDLTGSYSFEGRENVKKITQDGEDFFVIDGLSVNQAPTGYNRTASDINGTSADLMSVILQSDDKSLDDLTVQDLVRENNAEGAYIQLQDRNNAYFEKGMFSRDYVPVAGNFPGQYGKDEYIHQQDVSRKTESIFNGGQRLFSANFSGDDSYGMEEQAVHLSRMVGTIENDMSELKRSSLAYMTSGGNGGYTKGTRTVTDSHGVSGLAGARNIFSEDDYDIGEVFVGEDYAKKIIGGNERSILEANGLSLDDFGKGEEGRAAAQEHILERLKGTRGDDDFQVFSVANRYPTQSEGSVLPVNLRIDEYADKDDERIKVSRGIADLLGADFDGDSLYLTGYNYNEHSETNYRKLQGEMSQVHAKVKERAQARIGTLDKAIQQSPYAELLNIDNANLSREERMSKINGMFQNFNNSTSVNQQVIANEMKSQGIGTVDNAMVGARNMLRSTLGAAEEHGVIGSEEYVDMMGKWDEVNNKFVQNFISAKKIDTTKLAGGKFQSMSNAEQLDYLGEYVGGQTEIPNMIRNLQTGSVGDLMKEIVTTGALDENSASFQEEYNLFEETFTNLAYANEASENLGGMNNPSFAIGKKSSSDNKMETLVEDMLHKPENLVPTPGADHMAEELFGKGSDAHLKYQQAQKANKAHIAQNFGLKRAGKSIEGTKLAQASGEQVEMMSSLVKESLGRKSANDQANVGQQLMKMTKNVASSDSFKLGAGMAAMWMVSSAIKRGPTPEGNEAQQEGMAAPEEIDPSRLLTSPTARVTPQKESVRLQISGTGNADQDMLAGIVNNSVNQMTGMPMQMHLDITDNTQKLDTKFFEDAVSNTLGV